MNLFLLAAVPLSAVILYRLFPSARPVFSDRKNWIPGAVWAVLSLVAASPFGAAREFDGNLLAVSAGLLLTDLILVPGAVVLAWILTRPRSETWVLTLWLVLVFSMAGIRDFAATTRVFDLTEYLLVPLDRLVIVLLLPPLTVRALAAPSLGMRIAFWSAAAAVALTGPLTQVLSFGGWGWIVWPVLAVGLAGGLVWQKKAAPTGSGISG